jgi:coenzyme F420-reducing hydrogenase beta subunit
MLRFVKRLFERPSTVAEMASQVREGMECLARAVCALAVERHAKDPGHHRELAAILYIDCMNNFHDVKVRPETREWLAKLLGIDPRNVQKWNR